LHKTGSIASPPINPSKRSLLPQVAEKAVPNDHPYVGGNDPCAWDFALAPKLYLARWGSRLLKVGSKRLTLTGAATKR
jgi:hypothetical protein